MDNAVIIYRGNVRVYLQGMGALQPVNIGNSEYHIYYVGTEESSIIIKDHRHEPNQAALAKLENRFEGEFADVFNQPAEVEILENEGKVEIEMLPGKQDAESPILWMGVIFDGKMSVHNITWETLKPISANVTAFAVLVND
ncbi:MAG TPA: hypothetical protein VIS72_08765 [Anaerolineales bacterium]